jgi:hypothetical protein
MCKERDKVLLIRNKVTKQNSHKFLKRTWHITVTDIQNSIGLTVKLKKLNQTDDTPNSVVQMKVIYQRITTMIL